MKIRVFGFRPEKKKLPLALKAVSAFAALQENNGKPIDRKELLRAAATTMEITHDNVKEDWWIGMILRARDAKSFNHLSQNNGKLVLTAQQLGDGKIAEVAYFIANPRTGSGFFASYYQSPGFGALQQVCKKLFNQTVRNQRTAELLNAGSDEALKANIRERYKGTFEMSQLARAGNLKTMIQEFKRVSAVELRFTNVQNTGGFFKKLKAEAKTETAKFNFPLDFVIDDDIADEIADGMDNEELLEAFIEGTDNTGTKRRLSSEMARNKLMFAEEEYDTLLGDLSLELDNWEPTILESPVISWMKKLLNSATNRNLLET